MPDAKSGRASEERLDALRSEAAGQGRVGGEGWLPAGAPFPPLAAEGGYYGQPLLKAPVWTWEVPLYFFVGGAAGSAALLAEASRAGGDREAALARDARWLAFGGAVLSAPLLIADLGRPARFLYMLRVLKPQSPMSVGVWTLVAFSGAAAASLGVQLIERRVGNTLPIRLLGAGAGALSASTGLAMATYTGVLVGVTAIPVWARHVRLLPLHFGISGLASAVALLELRGHRSPALATLGLTVAALETAIALRLELSADAVDDPLRHGRAGLAIRSAGIVAGPASAVLRGLAYKAADGADVRDGAGRRTIRIAAAAAALAGALLIRIGWIAAGRASSRDFRAALGEPDRS